MSYSTIIAPKQFYIAYSNDNTLYRSNTVGYFRLQQKYYNENPYSSKITYLPENENKYPKGLYNCTINKTNNTITLTHNKHTNKTLTIDIDDFETLIFESYFQIAS